MLDGAQNLALGELDERMVERLVVEAAEDFVALGLVAAHVVVARRVWEEKEQDTCPLD
jgi:hypothetical protein